MGTCHPSSSTAVPVPESVQSSRPQTGRLASISGVSQLQRRFEDYDGRGEFLHFQLDADAPQVIALAASSGFLPMASGGTLLAKLHHKRCILSPEAVHCGRKTRRCANKGFRLTIDTAWENTVKSIRENTFTTVKGDCWLNDKLSRAYLAVNELPDAQRRGVGFHSVELWDNATGKLVAGEIGYTVGAIYSSCTGFSLKSEYPGVGNVQLAALGQWLAYSGFKVWDLGQEMRYKLDFGGQSVPRAEWVASFRKNCRDVALLSSPAISAGDVASLLACPDR